MAQGRARVRQVLEVRRPGPVPQVGEVGDEGGLREELLRREVVEVEGVGERLDELWPENVSACFLLPAAPILRSLPRSSKACYVQTPPSPPRPFDDEGQGQRGA